MKTVFYLLFILCGASFGLWFVFAFGYDMGLISRVWYDVFLIATIGTGLMGFIVAQVLIFNGSK
jgi:hypothetical protein